MSLSRLGISLRKSRIMGIASSGRSTDTPPGRTYWWFILRPLIASKMSSTSSRSRKPKSITESAPSSMPPVASATRCEEIRLSSIIRTRMTLARSGMSSVMPSSFSTPRQYTVSLKNGDR
nr:hypothetical protein CPGR_01583 [Mycolicibacter nonchromogenicus]